MYSKQEASLLRQQFWTTFGKYMAPIQSAEGTKVNWINYKTGVKSIFFRMDADSKSASISIYISPKDYDTRLQYYNLLAGMKSMFDEALQEEWIWLDETTDENDVSASKIYKELAGVNIFNKADWPVLISFFKPRIIALDNFWSSAKYGFEVL